MSEIGRRLALLITEPDPVPGGALPAALAARQSVQGLLDTLALDGVLGRRLTARGDEIRELVRNPTGTFNRARAAMPKIAADDVHDLLVQEGRSRAEDLWLGVHRHAVVAEHEWSAAEGSSRPTGPRAWPVTADAIAVTAALAHLEPAVADALRRDGRPREADAVEQVRWSGLDRAVDQAWRLATAGPLEDPTPLRKPGVPNAVVVRSRPSQREGGRRLLAQLHLTPVTPKAMQAVLVLHGRTLLAAAELVGPSPTADALRTHARAVDRAQRRLDGATALAPADGRVVAQAQQLHLFTTAELAAGRRGDVGMEVARQTLPLAAALADVAAAKVRAGHWLVADGTDHTRPLWVQADMGDHRPDVLDRLADLVSTGREVATRAAPDPFPAVAPEVRLTPPREVLTSAVQAVTSAPLARPEDPSARLAPPAEPERPLTL